MSTRSTTHFTDGGHTEAIIYRHTDGSPQFAGVDILRFLDEVKAQTNGDTRFDDPSYLAAKYVVFLAGQFTHDKSAPLAFISVGVVSEDPGDIEYRYTVDCGAMGAPTVTCNPVRYDAQGENVLAPAVPIALARP